MQRIGYSLMQKRPFHRSFRCMLRKRKSQKNIPVLDNNSDDVINLQMDSYCPQLVSNNNIPASSATSLIKNDTDWKNKLQYAATCYRTGTKEALENVVLLAKENCLKQTSASNRLLYLAMDMALNQNRIDVAEDLFKLLPRRVHVLATSLRIRFFVRQERFLDALEEIEKVLNEDTAGLDVSLKVSKSVLDEFYAAVASREDATFEAKRLFTLQRLLSLYNRRTTKTITELLLSDMVLPPAKGSMESLKIDDKLLNKIVKHVPEVLTDDKL